MSAKFKKRQCEGKSFKEIKDERKFACEYQIKKPKKG